jgi:hypothetical protein
MTRFLLPLLLALCLSAADEPPHLTAAQYTRAESVYWKVMARCCIRKPGALKIHLQIERAVAEGKTDQAIIADFTRRFGGGPVQFDNPDNPSDGGWRDSVYRSAEWAVLPGIGLTLWGFQTLVRKRWTARRLR